MELSVINADFLVSIFFRENIFFPKIHSVHKLNNLVDLREIFLELVNSSSNQTLFKLT